MVLAGLAVLATALLASCTEEQKVSRQQMAADSLMAGAYGARDYDSLIALADELQGTGALSDMKACYWRGYAFSRQRKMRSAEMEWKNAVALGTHQDDDLEYYAKSANRLAGLLYMKADYEATMEVALPAMKALKAKDYDMNTDYANLLTFVGNCQLRLGQKQDAATSYAQTYQYYLQLIDADNNIANYSSAIVGIITITDSYLQAGCYQESYDWTGRLDALLLRYREHPQATLKFIDKQWARLNLYRACALEGLGHKKEAAKAYQEALSTDYAQTGDGQIESTNYLMVAGRWSEAANNFRVLKDQIRRYDLKMSFDNIQAYLLPKFRANVGAMRTDTAIATGLWICSALDSAILWEKQNNAAELATIYQTQQKEAEIMEQKADLSRQRLVWAIIVLVIIILGFTLIIYFRHQASMRLERAYHDLEIANGRAEESSRMKSNFIQQISHEIRTPLNILSGFTQIITTPGMELDEDTRNDINRQITENTDRITGLVNKMLELSDVNSRSVIDRNDMVAAIQIAAEAAETSGITTAKHLSFDLQLTPEAETATLQTNLRAAVRALSLVLDNARKFTAPAEASQKSKTLTGLQRAVLHVQTEAEQVIFAVEDTGPGIPENEAERIFDEFVQLDEYYDGTGIGLTVARSLARRLGGDLVLDTTHNTAAGARFVLTLPMVE